MPFYFLLVVLTLAPLPFACARPWSWSLLSLLIGLVGIFWFLAYLFANKKPLLRFDRLLIPGILFLSAALWAFLQTTTWLPAAWGHPLWQMTAETLGRQLPHLISLAPDQTLTALMRLICYGLVFVLSSHYCQKSAQAEKLLYWLAISGFVYAFYGLVIFFGGFSKILWFDKWAYQNDVTSTFVNRNSYATFAGLSLFCLFPTIMRHFKAVAPHGLKSNFNKKVFIENLIASSWFPLLMLIVVASALLLSHSRGGFLSISVAIFVFLLTLSLSQKIHDRSFTYATVAIVFFLIVLFSISGTAVMDRLRGTETLQNERLLVYEATLDGIASNPLLGFGYGTYEKSFRLYRSKDITGSYDLAHNTYLENLFELGIPAASALFMSILWVALRCLSGIWRRQRNWIYPAIGFAATVQVGVHSLVDFSLQIPAVAVTYAAILGAGFAQSFGASDRSG